MRCVDRHLWEHELIETTMRGNNFNVIATKKVSTCMVCNYSRFQIVASRRELVNPDYKDIDDRTRRSSPARHGT